MHIPKTGGNTFKAHLKAIFGDDICYRYTDQFKFVDVYSPTPMVQFHRAMTILKLNLTTHTRLRPTDRCVHGHLRAETYLNMFPDGFAITWLREPLERLVSQYYYWKRHPYRDHTICNMLRKLNLSLRQFAEIEVMRNLQCRYFNTLGVEDLWFVGITEQYRACLDHFGRLLDVDLKNASPQNTNPMKGVQRSYEIDSATRARIVALNSRDYRLYEQAVERALKAGMFTNINVR
jgi:hypothetical protein